MPNRDPAIQAAYSSAAHRQHRARLLKDLPAPCGRCGQIIPAGIDPQWVHLDHLTPMSEGGRAGEGVLSHRKCNASHGAALGAMQRRQKNAQELKDKMEKGKRIETPPFLPGPPDK